MRKRSVYSINFLWQIPHKIFPVFFFNFAIFCSREQISSIHSPARCSSFASRTLFFLFFSEFPDSIFIIIIYYLSYLMMLAINCCLLLYILCANRDMLLHRKFPWIQVDEGRCQIKIDISHTHTQTGEEKIIYICVYELTWNDIEMSLVATIYVCCCKPYIASALLIWCVPVHSAIFHNVHTNTHTHPIHATHDKKKIIKK